MEIGTNYNQYKWDTPKVLYINDKLFVIDGMHRIYGVFVGNLQRIVVEILTDLTWKEAMDIFLDQGKDRKPMSPKDLYNAAITAQKPEYLKLKEICEKNGVKVNGDKNSISNPIGVLTPITDGLRMAKASPELLDRILKLIEKLQWNCGRVRDGKAYSAKVLRVMNKLYAYYTNKVEAMEVVLINNCKGSEFFTNNLSEKYQEIMFDYLSEIINQNIDIVLISTKKPRGRRKVANA